MLRQNHVYEVLNVKRRVLGEEHPFTLVTLNDLSIVYGLENAIEHAIVFGSTDEILPKDLPEVVIGSAVSPKRGYHYAVRDAKRKIVRSAVEQALGNYSDAAQLLGIHVNNLHRLIRELDLKTILSAGREKSKEELAANSGPIWARHGST